MEEVKIELEPGPATHNNNVVIHNYPLYWYVDKIERHEPFTSLLYGDGEWMVALGGETDNPVSHYKEIVTRKMQTELLDSLSPCDPDIIRGTDPSLIRYMEYAGRDGAGIRKIGRDIERLLLEVGGHFEFVDGTVWDREVRGGRLGPLLKVLHKREVFLVANDSFWCANFLHPKAMIDVPDENAYSVIDQTEELVLQSVETHKSLNPVVILCMGLGAIPLALRLRLKLSDVTILDLGSTLDVFVGLGGDRGWRRVLYGKTGKPALLQTLKQNLEGVCGEQCGRYRVDLPLHYNEKFGYYINRGVFETE